MRNCRISNTFHAHYPALLAALLAAAGCGGTQEVVAGSEKEVSADDGPKRPRFGAQAEIGALDEGQVNQVFKKVMPKLERCFGSGTNRVPYLSGTVTFKLRVTKDGRARWIYLKDSNLGDRVTEDCMLGALKGVTWPSPVDGDEGLAESGFDFTPGGDERMPVDWSPEQLGPSFNDVKPKLSQCRSDAGAGPLKVTLYVGTDGTPGPIGVSVSDEKGEAAVRCVIDTLSALKLPSPGSFASKVSVVID